MDTDKLTVLMSWLYMRLYHHRLALIFLLIHWLLNFFLGLNLSLGLDLNRGRQSFVSFHRFLHLFLLRNAIFFKLLKLLGKAMIWAHNWPFLPAEIECVEERHAFFSDKIGNHTG